MGSFIAGPIITKTKAYKEMVVSSLTTLLISCILILIGLKMDNLIKLCFSSIVMQGLFTGILKTSNYEFLAEVIYPIKPISAGMLVIVLSEIIMLILSITGQLQFSSSIPLWSMALPVMALQKRRPGARNVRGVLFSVLKNLAEAIFSV